MAPRFSLKLKIILLFFGLSSMLSVGMVYLWHRTLEQSLFQELQSRLGNIAFLSSRSVDSEALSKLIERLETNAMHNEAMDVMKSPEYAVIARQLREIVAHEEELLLYAYIVWPDPSETHVLVLADNSAIEEAAAVRVLLRDAIEGGKRSLELSETTLPIPSGMRENTPEFDTLFAQALEIEEVWRYGYRADISDFPVMIEAMRERANLVEQELYFDAEGERVGSAETGIWSFSGYAPVYGADGKFLGLLGVDISANQMKAALAEATRTSIFAGIASMVFSLLVSLLLGWYISRRILDLKEIVQQFARRRLDVRAKIHSGDEVQDLAESFNEMANQIQAYSQNLEGMVKDRTRELKDANQQLLGVNRQIMRDLEMARRVQESILPRADSIQASDRLRIACRYQAMESVGGDLYDFFKVGRDQFGFLIADVSGHGVGSALITSLAKVSFQTHSRGATSPAAVCGLVNTDLYGLIGDLQHYLTAFYLVLNVSDGSLRFCSAGHPPAILYRGRARECLELEAGGVMIGVLDEEEFTEESFRMEAGDKLLLFTDGITEARRATDDLYGPDRLLAFIKDHGASSPEEILDGLVEDVSAFTGSSAADDDRALVCIEYKG